MYKSNMYAMLDLYIPTILSSSVVEQLAVNQQVVGSSPTQIAKFWMYSSVVERVTVNHLVGGSNPSTSASFIDV